MCESRARKHAHRHTNCTVLLSCTLLYPQQCDSSVKEGLASPGVAHRGAEETKSLASRLRLPSLLQPPRLHPQHSPRHYVRHHRSPQRCRHTSMHIHTHTLQAVVRQAGSHPAKSLIHMPSQPILTGHVGYGMVCR